MFAKNAQVAKIARIVETDKIVMNANFAKIDNIGKTANNAKIRKSA